MSSIKIYTKPGCPFCQAAKDDMRIRGIEFEEISISDNNEARNKVIQLTGQQNVPVIVDGEKVTVGFGGS